MQSTQQATRDGLHRESVAGTANAPAGHAELTCRPNARDHGKTHRFRVEPGDVGVVGVVDGAKLLEWIDEVAYDVAAQWSGRYCVTAYVGNMHVDRPIGVGELVELHASLVYTGCSSMHILVTVCSSDSTRPNSTQTSQCPIIFIAVDDYDNPVEVPAWTPVTMLELQRHRQARVRIAMRKRIEGAIAAESYTEEGTAPRATLRFCTDSADVNWRGKVGGGRVMRWIDEAASGCGADWTGTHVITSYIAGIRLYRPINIAHVVDVTARLLHTGPRSIHIGIHVTTTDTHGGEPRLASRGVAVVVSLDECGNARPVPQWEPDSDEDHRLDQHARHLIELRRFIEPFTSATAVPANTSPSK
jgi:acyl-CoA hydrolase